ncbi:MAG: AMP-binding protein [Alphaproteobacteria bacterium]|nr:AMP-binding protein [Alphaproteobacteria bacterium]
MADKLDINAANSSSKPTDAAESVGPAPDEVLAIVRGLAQDLHPRRKISEQIGLDSALDADIGIDSLGRAELLHRLELAFRVHLPEDLLVRAETPRDLFSAIQRAVPDRTMAAASRPAPVPQETISEPKDAESLIAALDWHVEAHPERPHLFMADSAGATRTVTYGQLAENAKRVAAGLRRAGLEAGDRVAIMLPTEADFFYAFFGALYAGGVPVPLYPPVRLARIEEHVRRQAAILKNAGASVFVTLPAALRLAALLKPLAPSLHTVETVEGLRGAESEAIRQPHGGDLCMLQYTSGSTGDPKGVMLSHANILANIRAMGDAMDVGPHDVFISWLPLYHDMGLIGAWLGSLYYGAPVVMMSPLQFIMRPESWLWAVHRHRGTITAAPNFAFEHCLQNVDDAMIEGLDLSSLRVVVDGAEPVSAVTLRRFADRFAAYGLDPGALAPSYGLAENAVGLTCSPPGRGPVIDRVDRMALARDGKAEIASASDDSVMECVSCGRLLPGHELRIVDETGRELPDRREGRLQFRGPSATKGYFNNETQTRALFDGSWLESGDLAYSAEGDVYLTGRSKDLIIRAGRNIHPHEIEDAVGDLPGVRKNGVAVFGSIDRASGTERIVVAAETDRTDAGERDALTQTISETVTDLLEMPPEMIVLAPPDAIPKTPSGKIRRAAARDLFETGRLGGQVHALRLQLLRLALSGAVARLRRFWRMGVQALYAAYWWLILVALGGLGWLLVLAAPSRRLRWGIARSLARLMLAAAGIPLRVEGAARPMTDGCVLVANHASYFDGVVVAAAVPGEPVFVAKIELASQFFAGALLRRLGAQFVSRQDPEAGLQETATATQRVGAHETLLFFPEGTFTRAPGLRPFHLGAFVTAAQAGVPVRPFAIRGTRAILRDGQWFPRRGPVTVTFGEALTPDGCDFASAVQLRDAAREFILEHCGEPGL